jgi:hypothetical protein
MPAEKLKKSPDAEEELANELCELLTSNRRSLMICMVVLT